MSGLLDLLNSDMGKQIITGVSQQSGASQDKTADVLSMALPVLMGAMRKNASTPQGAEGLLGALNSKHDGSILDNLGGLFQGGVDKSVMEDGAGILGHVLGAKRPAVQNALGQEAGIDASAVGQILEVAAPILMGFLGRQTRQTNVSDASGLGSLLSGVMGSDQPRKSQSLIEQLIDADGDGSIIDDVAGMVLGGSQQKKRGGLGGLLGGLFGKK